MACIEVLDTCITQGNDWVLDHTLTEDGVFDDNGNPVKPKNLTGASVALNLKETIDGAVIQAVTVSIVDAVNGQVSYSLTAAQTETLISGTESRKLYGAPQVTYQDGTIEDLLLLEVDVHQSWN